MPGDSGPQMIEKLGASGVRLPVVFVSGYTNDRLATLDFDTSAVSLIRKPFLATELTEIIEGTMAASEPD